MKTGGPEEIRELGDSVEDLLEFAWAVIANAGAGDWQRETEGWRGAALRWRDQYFAWLDEAVARGRRPHNATNS